MLNDSEEFDFIFRAGVKNFLRNKGSCTDVPIETINAYKTALYRVFSDKIITLQIGKPSPELGRLMSEKTVASCAFITACNPNGKLLTVEENCKLQTRLIDECSARNIAYLHGEGVDEKNVWPGEPSLLLFGVSLSESLDLGGKYEQNAIVWISESATPELWILR